MRDQRCWLASVLATLLLSVTAQSKSLFVDSDMSEFIKFSVALAGNSYTVTVPSQRTRRAARTRRKRRSTAPTTVPDTLSTGPELPSSQAGIVAPSTIGPIFGDRRRKVYHLPDCPDYHKVARRNRVLFTTREEAEAAGYKRPRNCP